MNLHEQLSEYFSIWKEMDALYSRFAKLSGISDTAFWILYCIRESKENITQKTIREQWSISKQTVHSALKELEKKRILSLRDSESDKRSKRIFLTEEGRRFSEKYLDLVCGAEDGAFKKMSDSERDALLRCSKKYLRLFKGEADKIFEQGNIAPPTKHCASWRLF
ncbi:MAG: MarR family transcriptional regulator [Spirochaetaceae bacterium]|jgi:DNA-binding MarR family transcriptional regulator|nr:MarR family transcriptional regulator [Spirochaetaceae bacterium]